MKVFLLFVFCWWCGMVWLNPVGTILGTLLFFAFAIGWDTWTDVRPTR